ncbi:MAG: hypothetical protein ACLT4C_00870 [Butyricicoccus sp.]
MPGADRHHPDDRQHLYQHAYRERQNHCHRRQLGQKAVLNSRHELTMQPTSVELAAASPRRLPARTLRRPPAFRFLRPRCPST